MKEGGMQTQRRQTCNGEGASEQGRERERASKGGKGSERAREGGRQTAER